MAQFSDARKLQHGFFHSLSKTATEATQAPYESAYKSGHSVFSKDVFVDSIGFAQDEAAADLFVANNPSIVKKYTQYTLSPILGSNNQAYSLIDSGKYVRPFITPVDVMSSTGLLSFGYDVRIYQQNGTFIPPTLGSWNVDAYAGLILFNPGYTPVDLGWGDITITCYVYVGATLVGGGTSGSSFITGVLGETVSKGQPVYQKEIDGKWYLSRATNGMLSNLSICVIGGAPGSLGSFSRYSTISGISGLAPHKEVYVSQTSTGVLTTLSYPSGVIAYVGMTTDSSTLDVCIGNIAYESATSTADMIFEIDGGNAISVYLVPQILDSGGA